MTSKDERLLLWFNVVGITLVLLLLGTFILGYGPDLLDFLVALSRDFP